MPQPMGQSPASSARADNKKTRAKHACRVCNSRRVRCDVTDKQPCTNCVVSGASCEVLPSKRGRYPRRSRRLLQSNREVAAITPLLTPRPAQKVTPSSDGSASSAIDTPSQTLQRGIGEDVAQDIHQTHDDTARSSPAPAAGTLFFGESNFLTLVPGGDRAVTQSTTPGTEKPRLTFPIPNTPQSTAQVGGSTLSASTMRYLRDEGALILPDLESCLPAIQSYFTWFHPSFPILDRAEITRRLASMDISRLLLQAILFIGATYCDDETISAMGFQDRSKAKTVLYTRARLLFHADWEKDEIILIQSLFLMSFWRGGPADVRDVRYWLGVVITLSESYGLHRSARSSSKTSHAARMRRRIWWSIYVRERQAAASLGLPSRIRDEDCDIESLSPSDLESEMALTDSPLGSCHPEHVTYAIKMVEIARLLGRIIDLHFVPGRSSSTEGQLEEFNTALEIWRQSLPENMKSTTEDGADSVWACLLHLAYNHLRILIHRNSFLRPAEQSKGSEIVVRAACRISRIAEDMSTQGTLRFGQMHLITSIFSSLCIHTISIRRSTGVSRRLAEHRAETCLLCLKEVQKYWRINNNVLDLFLKYLDSSIAARLNGHSQPEGSSLNERRRSDENVGGSLLEDFGKDGPLTGLGQTRTPGEFEEQYLNLINGNWESDDALAGLGLFLQAEDPSQTDSGLNFLGRSL